MKTLEIKAEILEGGMPKLSTAEVHFLQMMRTGQKTVRDQEFIRFADGLLTSRILEKVWSGR